MPKRTVKGFILDFLAKENRDKATIIIQHDARDVEKLPVFPAFAK